MCYYASHTFPGHAPNSVICTVQRLLKKTKHTGSQSHCWNSLAHSFMGLLHFEIIIWLGNISGLTWLELFLADWEISSSFRVAFQTILSIFFHKCGKVQVWERLSVSQRNKKTLNWHSQLNIKQDKRDSWSKAAVHREILTKKSEGRMGEHIRGQGAFTLTVIRSMATGRALTGRCLESIHIRQYEECLHHYMEGQHPCFALIQPCLWVDKAKQGIKRSYGVWFTLYNVLYIL